MPNGGIVLNCVCVPFMNTSQVVLEYEVALFWVAYVEVKLLVRQRGEKARPRAVCSQ